MSPKKLNPQEDSKDVRSRDRVVAIASGFFLIVFLVLAISSLFASPGRSEQFVSLAVSAVSIGSAFLAFRFLSGQTANIEARGLGVTLNIGGALAAAIILFGALQFGIRGKSSLYVQIFSDDDLTQLWSPPVNTASPEFAAALPDYSIVATPDYSNLRFPNLPIFESTTLYSRDPQWTITRVDTSDDTCFVSGNTLSGWCSEAKIAVSRSNCLHQWNGSGEIPETTFYNAIMHLAERMREVGYQARLEVAVGQETEEALTSVFPTVRYTNADFCTAVNEYKVQLQRLINKPVSISLSCSHIGIAVAPNSLPEIPDRGGWSTSC